MEVKEGAKAAIKIIYRVIYIQKLWKFVGVEYDKAKDIQKKVRQFH